MNFVLTTPDELERIVSAAVQNALSSVSLPTTGSNKRFVDEEAAASIMGTTASALRSRRCRGRGPAYSKDGGKIVYDVRDIEAHMEKRKVKIREN